MMNRTDREIIGYIGASDDQRLYKDGMATAEFESSFKVHPLTRGQAEDYLVGLMKGGDCIEDRVLNLQRATVLTYFAGQGDWQRFLGALRYNDSGFFPDFMNYSGALYSNDDLCKAITDWAIKSRQRWEKKRGKRYHPSEIYFECDGEVSEVLIQLVCRVCPLVRSEISGGLALMDSELRVVSDKKLGNRNKLFIRKVSDD